MNREVDEQRLADLLRRGDASIPAPSEAFVEDLWRSLRDDLETPTGRNPSATPEPEVLDLSVPPQPLSPRRTSRWLVAAAGVVGVVGLIGWWWRTEAVVGVAADDDPCVLLDELHSTDELAEFLDDRQEPVDDLLTLLRQHEATVREYRAADVNLSDQQRRELELYGRGMGQAMLQLERLQWSAAAATLSAIDVSEFPLDHCAIALTS